MSSAFQGISIATTALRAFQRELDVTGNNIANANTDGYTRQRVNLVDTTPTLVDNVYEGNGVKIAGVDRIRDAFLDARNWAAQANSGKSDSLKSALGSIEGVFNEPSNSGIASAVDSFYNAFSGLASNPSDVGQKVKVQAAGNTLTSLVRQAYSNLSDIQNQQASSISDTITQIQNLSNQIADLNKQITAEAANNASPNDLIDQRDQAITKLSGLADIRTYRMPSGAVNINLNQLSLVQEGTATTIPTTYNAATSQIIGSNGINYTISGGSLAGQMAAYNQVGTYKSNLDALANSLKSTVNAIHQGGTNSLGGTNVQFFKDANPQTGAIDFDLAAGVKADYNQIASGTGASGDGSVALSISNSKDNQLAALGGQTVSKYYGQMISNIGTTSKYYQDQSTTNAAVTNQIKAQISSQSGVNLDDEMTNMLRFQRSYQAAAETLTIFDQVTQSLLNAVGK